MATLILISAFIFYAIAPFRSAPTAPAPTPKVVIKYVVASPTPIPTLSSAAKKSTPTFSGDPRIKETPKIVTIKEGMKIKEQPHFEKAEIGDLVYIYEQNQKVILYRPSEKKIIAYISYSSSAPSPTKE